MTRSDTLLLEVAIGAMVLGTVAWAAWPLIRPALGASPPGSTPSPPSPPPPPAPPTPLPQPHAPPGIETWAVPPPPPESIASMEGDLVTVVTTASPIKAVDYGPGPDPLFGSALKTVTIPAGTMVRVHAVRAWPQEGMRTIFFTVFRPAPLFSWPDYGDFYATGQNVY